MMTPLKRVRMSTGIKQAEIARAINVDLAFLSRLENNQLRQTPKVIQTQARIAEFLGLPIESLFPPDPEK